MVLRIRRIFTIALLTVIPISLIVLLMPPRDFTESDSHVRRNITGIMTTQNVEDAKVYSVVSDIRTIKPTSTSLTTTLKSDSKIDKYNEYNISLFEKSLKIRSVKARDLLLVYNRVPKCGSTSVIMLLRYLRQRGRRFTLAYSDQYRNYRLPEKNQMGMVKLLSNIRKPAVYNRHLHFIDFTRFGYPQPVYFNLVRDPIERLRSAYYFRAFKYPQDLHSANNVTSLDDCIDRSLENCFTWADFFIMIPYFCGQDDICRKPSEDALAKAKYNLINNYLLVGVTDEFETFVRALEFLVPQIFSGASSFVSRRKRLYHENVTEGKKPLKKASLDFLKKNLKEEYDFYYFVKQLFHQKMKYLNAMKH